MAYERICVDQTPDLTIVVGDVNSTLACALAATKLGVPVAHLESGLRSGDRSMPEEINRVATDAIADILWTPSPDADANLAAEGVPHDRVTFVGNIMLDAFEQVRDRIAAVDLPESLDLPRDKHAIVTLHRPSNVDDPKTLTRLMRQLILASNRLPLVFPVHPRTRARLQSSGLLAEAEAAPDLHLIEPLGYIQFINLVTRSSLVVTDSGGLQEETTYLGIPCLTLRLHTERPITVAQGTNRLVQPEQLLERMTEALSGSVSPVHCPIYWDGQTAERVVADLEARLFGFAADLTPSTNATLVG
jgi:UDP-N-acetylglucosamine 2-epimerase (non-hydrolysing)